MAITDFGTTSTGQMVQKITLSNGDLTVGILTLGAIVQSVRLQGVAHDLTLGSDDVADYQGDLRYHGSIVGPVANRITGAQAMIAGQTHSFDANEGRNCLHSGAAGLHLKLWEIAAATDTACTLCLTLPDGEGGFPGSRQVEARFSLQNNSLQLDITATSDAETLWNATNHSYWNLDGSRDWTGHSLQIKAEHWLPTDAETLPTGEIAPCAGSAMDFRSGCQITPGAPPLDHNFCLSDAPQPLRDVLTLQGQTGVTLTVATTEPGIQVYDGRGANRPGKPTYEGLAIEAQGWPDAPSQPTFPPITLPAQTPRVQSTRWTFTR